MKAQIKKRGVFKKKLNIGKDCSKKSFSLKKKEEEEGRDEEREKKGCTKNVPLCNESEFQTRWRQDT